MMDLAREWYYYSDSNSDSSSQERNRNKWESKINSDGSLFYVKYYPGKDDTREEHRKAFTNQEDVNDKPTGILSKIIRRRNSRRSSRRKDLIRSHQNDKVFKQESSKAYNEKQEQENKNNQVLIQITLDNNTIINRSLESLLGLKTVISESKLVVVGFSSNKASLYQSQVNIGDKLHTINNVVITKQNLEDIILSLSSDKEVLLGFLKEKTDICLNECYYQGFNDPVEKEYFASNGMVIYAKYEGLSEDGPIDQGVIYSFPKKKNILSQIRGAFFTLYNLLPSISSEPPRSSTLKFNDNYINVTYIHEKSELLLISIPTSMYFIEESSLIVASLTRCLEFMFQSLSRCFSNKLNGEFLDAFFFKLLTKMSLENIKSWEFETLMPAPCSFLLPKEIYMQVDDALNELESNYIPSLEGQRLFTVLGSCYFYKDFIVCNHLPNKDLLDITALMKQNGIIKLCKEGVEEFVFWREVYPLSCQRGITLPNSSPYSVPTGRWFLLIVGMDRCFLATILEAGLCSSRLLIDAGPNTSYVEETKATLRHIMKIAFPDLNSKQLKIDVTDTKDYADQMKSASTDSSSSLSSYADSQVHNKHYSTAESYRMCASGLKGRPSSENIRSLNSYGDIDYLSEEETIPVLGRRAERELALETHSQSRISVSDVSDDSDWLKDNKSTNSANVTELNDQSKIISPEDFIASPRCFKEKENVLIHFVNFEASEGVLISNITKTDTSDKITRILQTFRQHAHKIQKIFLNPILFKKLKSQEMSHTLNKSLVAVNEYGTLFQYTDDPTKGDPELYWVIGKLFFTPHPREIYVCYLDTFPQSIIEIAFQLALAAVR